MFLLVFVLMAVVDVKDIDVTKHTVDPFDRGEVLRESNIWAGEMSGWADVQCVRRSHVARFLPEGLRAGRKSSYHLLH